MKRLVSLTALLLSFALLSSCSADNSRKFAKLPLEKETEHFLLQYSKGDENATEDMAEALENAYEDLTVKYKSVPEDKIRVGIYPTYEDMQAVWKEVSPNEAEKGNEAHGVTGLAFHNNSFVVVSPNDWKHSGESYEESLQIAVHELAHVITNPYDLPVYLGEGLAFYEQGSLKKQSYMIRYAKNNQKGLSIPKSLGELASMSWEDQYGTVYVYSAALVDYIVNTYGYDGLVEMLKAKGDVTSLGTDADTFYNDWVQYLNENY